MQNAITRIGFPEIFVGFVAPVGTDLAPSVSAFEKFFKQENYLVIDLKVTDVFDGIKRTLGSEISLERDFVDNRIRSYINFGNDVRRQFRDDSVLAAYSILEVRRRRNEIMRKDKGRHFQKVAYLMHQFKRKEEIDLLRSVYGRLFFQVSVHSRRETRLHNLSRKIAHSHNSADRIAFMSKANDLLVTDENERGDKHGQRVSKIFHDADFLISSDAMNKSVDAQVERFCELLFSSNRISPTRMEYGMFAAKAAALRTLDLSRQVGAAIFQPSGEIISMGSNEVPKAKGGTYWSDDEPFDGREYALGVDSNDARKREILLELLGSINLSSTIDELMSSAAIKDSQFMDALEYGRIVHAEMSAISDAARLGRAVKDAVLYCTTFPCHMCAKHIVSSGLQKVVFLEPYPKSLASDLHSDSIEIERGGRGDYQEFEAVSFEHFYGVTPRRYRELFERDKRKRDGAFEEYIGGIKRPNIDYKAPFYQELEKKVVDDGLEVLASLMSRKYEARRRFRVKS